jgi:hypothetical protein
MGGGCSDIIAALERVFRCEWKCQAEKSEFRLYFIPDAMVAF